MAGRFVLLRPILPEDHRALYAISTEDETNFRWRYRGALPPFEVFMAGLHSEVMAQFVVCPKDDPRQILGLVVAYHADLNSGTCYLGTVMRSEALRGMGFEASCLFIRYLFRTWALRKIYMEVVEYNMYLIASGEGRLYHVEGRMKERFYYAGTFWDNLLLTVEKNSAEEYIERLLPK
jgi:RimJ/RimL family protein N-acetyltransferase